MTACGSVATMSTVRTHRDLQKNGRGERFVFLKLRRYKKQGGP